MAALTLRLVKGSPLTNAEVDQNFSNLNTELGGKANSGANADITSLTGVTGGISTADYVDFDTAATPAGAVGRVSWNDGDGTLDVGLKGGNVTLQLGQEQVQRIVNTTGATLTEGQVVYVNGAQGNRLTVALASASGEMTSTRTFGVVTENIANGAEGFVATSGLVRKLNTSAFAEGAVLWLSTTAGAYTTTKAVAPNHLVLVGFVVRSHATVGSIFVHIANGYELDELHDVKITSVTQGDMLVRTALNVWENKAPADVKTNLSLNNVENKSSATIRSELTSGNVTTALGYTPYDATNPAGYVNVTGARNAISVSGSLSYNSSSGVITYNQPTNISTFVNDAGYVTQTGARTAISVSGSLSYDSSTGVISYTQPTNVSTFTNDAGYLTGITNAQVIAALGFTPASEDFAAAMAIALG